MSSSNTMKALRLVATQAGAPPKLEFVSAPRPAVAPGHVLIKVRASAIHPSDLANARGLFPLTQYPRIPGRDYAGVVVEGPADLVGAEVYGTSGHTYAFNTDGFQAEYALIKESEVARKPANLTFVQAATVGVPYTTAALEIRRAGVQPSDKVLVIGSTGAVGSAAVQLAKRAGATVFKASRREGDDVNTATDPEFKALDALTGGRGVDVVIDTVGVPALLTSAIAKMAHGGRLVFISAPKTGPTPFTLEMRDFYRANLTLSGVNSIGISAEQMAGVLADIREGFESGALEAHGAWSEVALGDAVEAYEGIFKGGAGKYVVVMDEA